MTANMLASNSMDDYPLTLTSIVDRAERFHSDVDVVSRRPSGAVTRTTFGECAVRARRLARLESTFDADPELAALTTDLIEEVAALRRRLRQLEGG